MTHRMRIGIVGCASIAERMMIPAIKSMPELELVAIASRTREKAEQFASRAGCEPVVGYEALISRSDIDIIYMPLPTGLHLQYGTMAMRYGKHLLLEKSLAANYRDALQLVNTARDCGVALRENYMFEFHRQQQEVRIVLADECGEIRNFRASFGFPPLAQGNFRYDVSLGGGAVLDAGGYVLKSIGVFFPGSEVKIKTSFLHIDESGCDLWGSAMAEVAWQGQRFAAQLAFGFDNFYQCGIEVWGSVGKLSTARTFTAGPGVVPTAILEKQGVLEKLTLSQDNHFVKLLRTFVSEIAAGDFDGQLSEITKQAALQNEVLRLGRQ